jgi:hypothetical protein
MLTPGMSIAGITTAADSNARSGSRSSTALKISR